MTGLSKSNLARWHNYHKTKEREDVDVWSFTPGAVPPDPIAALRESAERIGDMLGTLEQEGTTLQALGSAWSFSDVVGGSGSLLRTALGDHIFHLPPALLGPAAAHPDRMILASAGTTVAQLNARIEPALSLHTSGAHDGQTLGGLLGTGTHGSVLYYGAFQNQVRGVHIVTDIGESWWIERGPQPWLAPAAAAALATKVTLDEDLFEAVLVHLGGLGVVNAVLLEVDEGYLIDIVKMKRILPARALEQLEKGDFLSFAKETWASTDEAPYYMEVILDPFAPFENYIAGANPALVTMFFRRPCAEAGPAGAMAMALAPTLEAPHETLNLLADAMDKRGEQEIMFPLPQAIAWLVAREYKVEPAPDQRPRQSTWGAANGPHKKQSILGIEFELFNAAFAVRRGELRAALIAMLEGFHLNGGGHQVFTLRFVSNAVGRLTFTRFPETVVINMDGARTSNSAIAAQNVALALEHAGLEFSQHWGKQGLITPNRFRRDFGDPADAASKAGKWSTARAKLLARPEMREILRNDALRNWGLA